MPGPARTIRRLMVANRGEIARRVFRTCSSMGIETVAVYSDADVGAPFVTEAGIAIPLGGSTAAESYLRGDALVAAALRARADAVHPGYGFLAESAQFAQAVIDAGLTWVGPSPRTIEIMGSKIRAREEAESAGIPILPGETLGHENHLTAAAIDRLGGLPLIIKASAGGGGKGMRIVRGAADLTSAITAARREAALAFGDETLFVERYLGRTRHVEIQIFGDVHGETVGLFDRDCTIQRRHQKILEECPSPTIDDGLRNRMVTSAVAAAQAVGYVGAGTVEFLVAPNGEYFFLEMNTRLQVEHPVTELVTGLDLVALQLIVAEGRRLPPEVLAPKLRGHAIEVRLCAEDANRDFAATSGTLERFSVPETVRLDSGVVEGSIISPYYDPMLAKVIAHAPSRDQAARILADALHRAVLDGVVTNRNFLVRLLRHPDFLAGAADSTFLDPSRVSELAAPSLAPEEEDLHAGAAALALQAVRRRTAGVLSALPSGWRNNRSSLQEARFKAASRDICVNYRFNRDNHLAELRLNGAVVASARLHACSSEEVDLELDGVRRKYAVRIGEGGTIHTQSALGTTLLSELPRFPEREAPAAPGSLRAPVPGIVMRVCATIGDEVTQGQPLVVIEAMKMEHEVVAPAAGLLAELHVKEGGQVQNGSLLAVVAARGQ
jgi:propionyl-CoA carboxylase alpha chain